LWSALNIEITILAVSYVLIITCVRGPFLFCLGILLLWTGSGVWVTYCQSVQGCWTEKYYFKVSKCW